MIDTVFYEADLCVIGGGLAGVCCAIRAARDGSRVVLMQDRPMLGGNASSEIRMWVCGAQGKDNRETGIIEEILLENLLRNPDKIAPLFDTVLLQKVKEEPRITLLLNCSCLGAETDGDRIVSVLGWCLTEQKRVTVKAAYFADCSGDSILAPLTGADFRFGREGADEFGEEIACHTPDRRTMGNSLLLGAHKTDRKVTFTPPAFAKKLTDGEVAQRMPDLENDYENFWYLELGGDRDCIADAEEIRDDLLALALGMWDYIKNSGKVAGSDFWQLDFLGFLPGKRESRRMMGDCIVTQRDIASGGRFPDTVAFGGWALDDHFPGGFFHVGPPNVAIPTPSPYGIPYRALYSRNIGNLFFAGRNISMTHAAMSSTRVMATCAVMGEAIGCAANLARERGLSPREVGATAIRELQARLQYRDCFLPPLRREISPLTRTATLTVTPSVPDAERLRNGLDRDHALFGEPAGIAVSSGSSLTYSFAEPTYVGEVRVTFDSDLNRNTLPGSRCEREHNSRLLRKPDSPTMTMPATLVRDAILTAILADGTETVLATLRDNARRTVFFPVASPVRSVTLSPTRTWGDLTAIPVISFDIA